MSVRPCPEGFNRATASNCRFSTYRANADCVGREHTRTTLTDITDLHDIGPIQAVNAIHTVNASLLGQHGLAGYPQKPDPSRSLRC